MRLLIVKTSSMGDVVHALPMVADLAKWLPGVEVDWLVEPAFSSLPAQNPGVSTVHRLPWRRWRRSLLEPQTWRAMAELQSALRQRQYELVIDAQGLLKSALWARRAGVPVAGYGLGSIREPLASLLYRHRHEVARQMHAVQRCRRLAASVARALGSQSAPGDRQPLDAPDFGLQTVGAYAHPGLPVPYSVLIPNASRVEKHWPEAAWQRLGDRLRGLGMPAVVLWGSAGEQAMAERIAEPCGAWVPPFLTVHEAAQLLAGAKLVVGLDTGLTHVAAALGRPVVGIYCDHEPGLTGITGAVASASLGGKGKQPTEAEVWAAVEQVVSAASQAAL